MIIQRTWKRDGSVNRMGMHAACKNIKGNAVRMDIRKESILTIRMLLARGERLETQRAVFTLAWRKDGRDILRKEGQEVMYG